MTEDELRREVGLQLAMAAHSVELERAWFEPHCAVVDRGKKKDPDPDAVAAEIAAWEEWHAQVERMRKWTFADAPLLVEQMRWLLARDQIEADMRKVAELRVLRGADEREAVRQAANVRAMECWDLRDALGVALGWPHAGEVVDVVAHYYADEDGDGVSELCAYEGLAVYQHSYSTQNTSHSVQPGTDRHVSYHAQSLHLNWEPVVEPNSFHHADPAGDIPMRVHGAPGRKLPVPIPRWPKPENLPIDVDPSAGIAVGEQLGLEA